MSRWVRWVCCALLLLCGSTASAQSSMDLVYGRDGFVVGFHGLAAVSPSGNRLGVNGDAFLSNSGGIGFTAEYRYHPMFSVELMAETVNRDVNSPIDPVEQFRLWTVSANTKIYLSPGRMQPYLLAGFGFGSGEETNLIPGSGSTAAMIRVGGGVNFYFTEHFLFDFAIEAPILFGSLTDMDYFKVGFGLKYRF